MPPIHFPPMRLSQSAYCNIICPSSFLMLRCDIAIASEVISLSRGLSIAYSICFHISSLYHKSMLFHLFPHYTYHGRPFKPSDQQSTLCRIAPIYSSDWSELKYHKAQHIKVSGPKGALSTVKWECSDIPELKIYRMVLNGFRVRKRGSTVRPYPGSEIL